MSFSWNIMACPQLLEIVLLPNYDYSIAINDCFDYVIKHFD